MATRMMMIFTKDELKRCKIRSDGTIYVDLHEYSEPEARKFVSNIMSLSREPLHLVLIHGYHRGTVLRNMLRGDTFKKRCKDIYADKENEGRTHFFVA